MGYKLTGADFTAPTELSVNVGATVGKSLGKAFADIGDAFAAQQKETNKQNNIQDEFETQLLVTNQKKIDDVLAAGPSAGYKEGTTLYEQWSAEVVKRGNAATQATIDIRFGDLTPEEKKEKLDILSSFNRYSSNSMTSMSGLNADVAAFHDPKKNPNQIVRGNIGSGENLLNLVTITQMGGKDATSYFGKGATSSRVLNVEGNDNEIIAHTEIPISGDFFNNMRSANPEFDKIILAGLDNGNISFNQDKDKLVFDRKINLKAYETDGTTGEGGYDFVYDAGTAINQNETLKAAGFLDEEADLTDDAFATNNSMGTPLDTTDDRSIVTFQETRNLANNNIEIKTYDVLNMYGLVNNKTFKKEVDATAGMYLSVGDPQIIAGRLHKNYGINNMEPFEDLFTMGEPSKIGAKLIADGVTPAEFFAKAPTADQRKFLNYVIGQHIFNDMYKNQEAGKGGVSLIKKKATGRFLKHLQDSNILNIAGELYGKGDDVYVRQTLNTQKITAPGVGNVYDKVYKQYADNPENAQAIFSSPIKVFGGKTDTFHLWLPKSETDPAGVYIVDASGTKIGNQTEGLQEAGILSALGRGKSK